MAGITSANWKARLTSILASVKDATKCRVIEDFALQRKAEGLKPTTIINQASVLRDLANWLGETQFIDVTKAQLIRYLNDRDRIAVNRVQRKGGEWVTSERKVTLSDSTIETRKMVFTGFYRWHLDIEKDERLPKELRILQRRKRVEYRSGRLITEEERDALRQAAQHPRDRAIVAVLYEAGLRAGELSALLIESVQCGPQLTTLELPQNAEGLKTGPRRIQLLPNGAAPDLHAWMESHPRKHDPKAPLFCSLSRRNHFGQLVSDNLGQVIKRLYLRAGIQSHIKPHDFRHTAATNKARQGYNEAELRIYFGWARSSNEPSHYVHLGGKDLDERMLEINGLAPEDKRDRAVMHAPCPVCDYVNPTTNIYCGKCRHDIKGGTAQSVVEDGNQALMNAVRSMAEEMIHRAMKAKAL